MSSPQKKQQLLIQPTSFLLQVLEDLLAGYPGTLLVVSHDRDFLDNVVTSLIAFDPDGAVREYVGGYQDYLRQRPPPPARNASPAVGRREATAADAGAPAMRSKLSNRQRQELARIPERIRELEREQQELADALGSTAFYSAEPERVAAASRRLVAIETELEELLVRWTELEDQG